MGNNNEAKKEAKNEKLIAKLKETIVDLKVTIEEMRKELDTAKKEKEELAQELHDLGDKKEDDSEGELREEIKNLKNALDKAVNGDGQGSNVIMDKKLLKEGVAYTTGPSGKGYVKVK